LNKLSKLKESFLNNQDFFKNYVYLNVSKGLNLVFPLFVTPYIIKVIGLNYFGSVGILQTLSTVFVILGNYGLDILNVIEISKHRNDKKLISQIVLDNYTTKTINLIVLFPLFYLGAFIFDKTENHVTVISTYSIVIATVYLPDFYFQGTEKVFNLMISNIFSKVLLVILLVIVIKEPGDYIYVNPIFGITQLLVPIYALIHFSFHLSVSKTNFNIRRLKEIYKKNWMLTLSNLNSNLFSASTSLLLSLYVSKSDVGLYIAIERIINILKGFVSVLSQALYAPVTLIYMDIQKLLKSYKNVLLPFGVFYFTFCISVSLFASSIADLFSITSDLFNLALRLFLISALFELANLPIVQYLIVSGQSGRYFRLITIISLINIVLNIILIPFFGIIACILCLIFCQALIFFYHSPFKFIKKAFHIK
jgi:PST family polysaccharide transporter